MARIQIVKGSIRLSWPEGARVDFGVLPARMLLPQPEFGGIRYVGLPDKRTLVICPWNLSTTQPRPRPVRWDICVPLPKDSTFRHAPAQLRRKVLWNITRTCERCARPTRYQLWYVPKMSSAVIAPVDFQKADVCPVCLELVLIDKLVQGNSYWRVVRFSNHFLFFTKYLQNLGSVVYDIARGRFIVPQSLPEKPIRVSEGCSFYRDNADQPAVSVIYKDGILQVHGAEDYDRLVGLFGPKENGVRLSKVVNAIGLQGIQLPADIVVSTIVLAPLESAEDSEDGLPA